MELGLLFGTERMEEDERDVLCFAHLMLQEFAAGFYLSEQDIVSSFSLKLYITRVAKTKESIESVECIKYYF